MRSIALTLPVALTLAATLAACSGGSEPATQRSSEPTVAPTTQEPVPTSSPTASPTASPSAQPVPTRTRVKPAREGDVDGDGTADLVRTSATVLSVTLSGSDRTVTAPIHAESPGKAPLFGSLDVDRDGYAEVFVGTAEGASTSFTTPYRFNGTALYELQLDGGPWRLGIGGTVTHGEGFGCTPAGLLEVRSADSTDGVAFTVHVSTYLLGVREPDLLSTKSVKAKQGDAAVEQSYTADCGAVGAG